MEISKPGILNRIDKVDYANLKVIDSVLSGAGFEIFIVGGCVRDLLLNKVPDEFDLTSNARPEQVQSLFKKVIPTGLQHGTVTVLLKKRHYEITTYRSESDYTDGRHPDSVRFEDNLEADISRRDFTINGLAYNVATETIYDYAGGVDDLNAQLIRAIGNPVDRFTEDGLRPVRALRFQVKLDFAIEPATYAAIDATLDITAKVAVERFFDELYKIFAHPNWPDFVEAVQAKGIWKLFVKAPWPEHRYESLAYKPWTYERASHIVNRGSAEIKQAMEAVFYYAIYGPSILKEYSDHNQGKDDQPAISWPALKKFRRELKGLRRKASEFFDKTKRPNGVRDIFLSLIEAELVFTTFALDADSAHHQRLLQAFIQNGAQPLVCRQLACHYIPLADLPLREDYFHFLRSCPDSAVPTTGGQTGAGVALNVSPHNAASDDNKERDHPPLDLGALAIGGNDLRDLGAQGADIGRLLDLSLSWVLQEPAINKKETLLERLKSEL